MLGISTTISGRSSLCIPLGKCCAPFKWVTLTSSLHIRFGLSYTTFSVGDLDTSSSAIETADPEAISVELSTTITNTGSVPGSETVQFYVSYPYVGTSTPEYQLRGFRKEKDVKPGETRQVRTTLGKEAFAHWDAKTGRWKIAKGTYSIRAGRSSDLEELGKKVDVVVERDISWRGI